MTPPWEALRGPLRPAQRAAIAGTVARLLRWDRTLADWPQTTRDLPGATPFVSLYVGGRLAGCYGHRLGDPFTRLARAFLAALGDRRGGELPARAAQVSYLRDLRPVSAQALAGEIEPGVTGIGVCRQDGRATILLPQVARDRGLDGAALVALLARKAELGTEAHESHAWFAFDTDEIVVRESSVGPAPASATDGAADWLASLVADDGQVTFAVDARSGARTTIGPLHHGRAAVLVRALSLQGRHRVIAGRARRWLASAIARGPGAGEPGWPAEPDRVAATLALAVLADLPVQVELRQFIDAHPELARSPWHAAQCVAALGPDAPDPLWKSCLDDLAVRPWAPWTALAARARDDRQTLARAVPPLIEALADGRPHTGGARVTAIPEIALTAIGIEALAGLPSPAARAACARGRRFLRRWQITGDRAAGPIDPGVALGAFPASPVSYHLRSDITAHALLALLPPA
jgi:hypothetical protein